MSDPSVIYSVSRVLKNLLDMVLKNKYKIMNATVTVASPDVPIPINMGDQNDRINLFLYRVTENSFLKNQQIPGAGNPGDYGHPPLSLDLCYLMTAYCSTEGDELAAHNLLGTAMRVFYDYPIITEKVYESAKGPASEESDFDPNLKNQFEKLKIVLDPLSLEDLMKIWTALTKPYRISVAYTVSVVQIEDSRKRIIPRPLGEGPQIEAKVYATSSRIPRIEEIHVYRRLDQQNRKEVNSPYAGIGDTLIILGYNFVGNFRVILGTLDVTDQIIFIRDDRRIELTIPNREELQPGPQTVTIALKMKMGKLHDEREHTISNSNLGIFILTPKVDKFVSYPDEVPPVLRIFGSRLYDPEKECITMIGDETIMDDPQTHRYRILSPDSITIPMDLVTGTLDIGTTYAVRVMVNGAENIEVERKLDQSP
jgi:hypothetical protein